MNQDYSDHFDEFNEATIADAAKRFETMLQRKESPYFSEEIFESLSEFYMLKGQLDLSLKACNFGLKHYPHSLDLILNKTQILINQFVLEEATELLDSASIFHPSDTEIEYFRGVILMCTGENAEALELFKQILPLAQEKENVFYQMGMAQVSLGEIDEDLSFI